MAFHTDIRSLCIGLLVGLVVMLAVGAVKDEGDYRLSMTSCDGYSLRRQFRHTFFATVRIVLAD